jgi:hypothetical protein
MSMRVFTLLFAAALLLVGWGASVTPASAQSPMICSYDQSGRPYNCHGTGLRPPPAPRRPHYQPPYQPNYQPAYYQQPYQQPYYPQPNYQPAYQPSCCQQAYVPPPPPPPVYQSSCSSCCNSCGSRGFFASLFAPSSRCGYAPSYDPCQQTAAMPPQPAPYVYEQPEMYPEPAIYSQPAVYPRRAIYRAPVRRMANRSCSYVKGRLVCRTTVRR